VVAAIAYATVKPLYRTASAITNGIECVGAVATL
jgi:hypothetical protein